MAEGIRVREGKKGKTYEASVYSPSDGKKIRKSFPTFAAARSWRADAKRSLDQGTLRAPGHQTIREAAEEWMAGAESGLIKSRSKQPFKPATLRGYRQALEDHILPEIGAMKLAGLTTLDLQLLVDRWEVEGQSASSIRNTIKPLQGIYRRAKARQKVAVNPTRDLELPAPRPKEVEIVAPEIAQRLVAEAPAQDRALWATSLYAGLRYGELRALRWGAVDLATGTIRVVESWDPQEGFIEPKTATSRRTVPLSGALRGHLLDLRLDADQDEDAFVFGREDGRPFDAATVYRRADKAWARAGLTERLRLHQARHTYASFMIAAGVNAKALCTYMGHSSIKVTYDLYGHLMPGNEAQAAGLLDAFLERANTEARLATIS